MNEYMEYWHAKYLTQAAAQQIDVDLMSSSHGFSIDQLMELAGLSVASAIVQEFQFPTRQHVLVVVGPGNNGGDGLVAARHLKHFGLFPEVVYPKPSPKPLFQGLVEQCKQLEIPIHTTLPSLKHINDHYLTIVDAIFGFSFHGDIKSPFDKIVETLRLSSVPITSIDIPSGWDVEKGNENGKGLEAQVLISLTAPKLCAQWFKGVHYLGGRFIPKSLAVKYELDLPIYPGTSQCVKLTT